MSRFRLRALSRSSSLRMEKGTPAKKSNVDWSIPEMNQETTLAWLIDDDKFSLLANWLKQRGVPLERVVKFGSRPRVVTISPNQGEFHQAMGPEVRSTKMS